jgi:hypothetical protein
MSEAARLRVLDDVRLVWKTREKIGRYQQTYHPDGRQHIDQLLQSLRAVLRRIELAGEHADATEGARVASEGAAMLRSQLPAEGLRAMASLRVLDGGPWSARLGDAQRILNREQNAAPDHAGVGGALAPADARVTFDEAIAGVPAFKLPPTPRSTLYRWFGNRDNQTRLGINKSLPPGTKQPLLVSGLLELHRSTRRKVRRPGDAITAE